MKIFYNTALLRKIKKTQMKVRAQNCVIRVAAIVWRSLHSLGFRGTSTCPTMFTQRNLSEVDYVWWRMVINWNLLTWIWAGSQLEWAICALRMLLSLLWAVLNELSWQKVRINRKLDVFHSSATICHSVRQFP